MPTSSALEAGALLGSKYRVNVDGVRLRAAPGTSQRILIPNLAAGTVLDAVDAQDVASDGYRWRHVRGPSGTVGWVAAEFLDAIQEQVGGHDLPAPGPSYRVSDDGVRVRSRPGLGGEILAELRAGTVVASIDVPLEARDGHRWRLVRVPDGTFGWIAATYLTEVGGVGAGPGRSNGVLSTAELYALVRRHGAGPGLDRIMVAAALTETGGDPNAIGDGGHSAGLWQMHDRGLGAGMSVAERCDPDTACPRMLSEFRRWYERWASEGRTGEDLAARTYLWTERPANYDVPGSAADVKFRRRWREAAA